jgi:hypothetical protein
VEGRRLIHLALPLDPERPNRFELVPSGGGRQMAGDPRVMNFRAFRCRWSRRLRSVEPPAAEPPIPHNFTAGYRNAWVRVRTSPSLRGLRALARRLLHGRKGRLVGDLVTTAAENGIVPLQLHTNGCGDFTLMAREHWFDLRGYPELQIFSLHLDALFCFMAHHGGAREEVLQDPMRIYHIEHSTGSGWTPEGAAQLARRIKAKGIPVLDIREVLDMAAEMRRRGAPLVFNDDHWGLAQAPLPETVLEAA